MKITVTTSSQALPDLLGTSFQVLDEAKSAEIAKISIQNTSAGPIYIENGQDATTAGSYMLAADREVEMDISNLAKLYFIAGSSLDVRVITT